MQDECRRIDHLNQQFLDRIVEMEERVQSLPELNSSFGQDTLKKQKSQYKASHNSPIESWHVFTFNANFFIVN